MRLRGTIEKVDATTLTVRERSGELLTLVGPADMAVTEVVPMSLADIQPGSFVGTAAMPQSGGTQMARRCSCFPSRGVAAGKVLVGRNGFAPPM